MSKTRMIDTSFWDDPYIVSLDPIEKLLFIYFLTNPLTNIAGIYEITLKRIAFDTGIDRDTVLKILDRFEEAGKIYYRDGYVIIKNFIKHQAITEKSKIKTGIEKILNELPDNIKITLEGLSIPYIYPLNYSNSNSNTNSNSNSNMTSHAPKKYIDVFNNEIFPITPFVVEVLSEYEKEMSDEVIVEAIKEAVRHNVRRLNYIEAILRDWKSKGIKDLAGAEALRREKNQQTKTVERYADL